MYRHQRLIILFSCIGLVLCSAGVCSAARLNSTLQSLSSLLKIEILVEDGIGEEYAASIPENAGSIDPENLIRQALNGFSYGVLYNNEKISKIWVYKSGKNSFVRISSSEPEHQHVFTNENAAMPGMVKSPVVNNPLRAPPRDYKKGIRTTRSGRRYVETSFGYRKPVFNTPSFKKRAHNPRERSGMGINTSEKSSGRTDYLARRDIMQRDALLSKSVMMNNIKVNTTAKKQ
jgi:hypothetical protein